MDSAARLGRGGTISRLGKVKSSATRGLVWEFPWPMAYGETGVSKNLECHQTYVASMPWKIHWLFPTCVNA
jgi:hypothetical protein